MFLPKQTAIFFFVFFSCDAHSSETKITPFHLHFARKGVENVKNGGFSPIKVSSGDMTSLSGFL